MRCAPLARLFPYTPLFRSGAAMRDRRGLAVHHGFCPDHLAAEGLADGLVAQADAENGAFAGKVADRRYRDAGLRRSEEHTSELQSREKLVCRLLLEKKKMH